MMQRFIPGLALALLAGCFSLDDPSAQFYEENYALWLATGPASYDMVLTRSCICQPPTTTVVIEVRNKVVTQRYFQDTGLPVPANLAADYPDVPGLFLVIRNALGRRVAASTYGYNRDYGYPELININYDINKPDEILFLVQSLTPVD
jgi:hypothetical protein